MAKYEISVNGKKEIVEHIGLSRDLFFKLLRGNKQGAKIAVRPLETQNRPKTISNDKRKMLDIELDYQSRKNWYNKTH
jgi:hypothetical protein